jgi:hypothetical protein
MFTHQDDAHAASTAVFETNELLKQILSTIPIRHFAGFRRVCKTWHSVIYDIKYCTVPERVYNDCEFPLPAYSAPTHISFNPILPLTLVKRGRHCNWGPYDKTHIDIDVDSNFNSPILLNAGHESFTSPPITQVALTSFPTLMGKNTTLGLHLKVNDGIRLRDLTGAIHEMGRDRRVQFLYRDVRIHILWTPATKENILAGSVRCARTALRW